MATCGSWAGRSANDDDRGADSEWLDQSVLTIVVVGASGDLAKKKTYPSLLHLFKDGLLPPRTQIWGFARSSMTSQDLRDRLKPYLLQQGKSATEETVDPFLQICQYQGGTGYGDKEAFAAINTHAVEFETLHSTDETAKVNYFNRLFYFAIPPNVFGETAVAIKETCMQDEAKGWTRLIVEKPFGRDLDSFEQLNQTLSTQFTEQQIYRIDHYLGKEMVQNLTILRFSNIWFERVWNRDSIQCVILTFKEPFGTEGRGGYFDQYGIIRDILQNHLLQVLSLLAMETPRILAGPLAGSAIRDAKVALLKAMDIIQLDDVILGQYDGYADDPTISNKKTNTPTFATIHLRINTPRWYQVPFILKAGKALDERKAEMRIQFKDAPCGSCLFGQKCPRNELVMRMQPSEAIYMKTNVKSPGFTGHPVQSELEVNYDTRYFNSNNGKGQQQKEEVAINPDAYTRLILDVLQGKQAAFVRDDELRRSWEIFTPLLHKIESDDSIRPIIYKQGSRGPKESDDFIAKRAGYDRNEDYKYNK